MVGQLGVAQRAFYLVIVIWSQLPLADHRRAPGCHGWVGVEHQILYY